jgi:hypothetical protein
MLVAPLDQRYCGEGLQSHDGLRLQWENKSDWNKLIDREE